MKYRTVSLILKVTSADEYIAWTEKIPDSVKITTIDVDPKEYDDLVNITRPSIKMPGDDKDGKTLEK